MRNRPAPFLRTATPAVAKEKILLPGGKFVRPIAFYLSVALLAAPMALAAQTTTYSPSPAGPQTPTPPPTPTLIVRTLPTQIYPKRVERPIRPLSRLAFSGGVSSMGVNMQAATNLNRYLNARATGNLFNYTVNNVNVNGFNIVGKVNMSAGGAGVDYYPFPNHGLRLSPGLLFYNQNAVSANVVVTGGTELTLNNVHYYASTTSPITGSGSVGLHSFNPAFTMTTGWGNMIPRKGEHWSFPLEIGAAVVGQPTVNLGLTSGQACDITGQNCVNVATDATLNANLQAQIAKYKSDLDPLKFYPIFSFGVAYSFKVR
jgi:hypothetical protein